MAKWIFALLLGVTLKPGTADAGLLLAPSVSYRTTALVPLLEEPTPNYYSYAFGLNFGWSFGQFFDLAAFVRYAPSSTQPSFFKEDLQLYTFGGEVGLRIQHLIYLGFRGGTQNYRLIHRRRDDEVRGTWNGSTFGGSIGVFGKIAKEEFVQLTFDIDRGNLAVQGAQRTIDSFAVTVTYVFIGFDNFQVRNLLLKQFTDSLRGG